MNIQDALDGAPAPTPLGAWQLLGVFCAIAALFILV